MPPLNPPAPRASQTVRARMLFWILLVTTPIYAGALYMSYDATAQRLEAEAERGADELAVKLAAELDATIRPIEGGVRTVGYQLEEIDPPQSQYGQRILGILKAWPDVYGSTIATETGNDDAARRPFAPYYFRSGEGFEYSDLATEKYAYRQLPWYRLAADFGQPVWSLPYFDVGGGDAWMVTYSVPYFRRQADGSRRLAGVVTADLSLDWVRGVASRETLGSSVMGWLSSPPAEHVFVAPIGATEERIRAFDGSLDAAAVRDAAEAMLAKNASFGRLPRGIAAKRAYLAVRNLETLGWRLILVFPRAELLAEARALLNRQLWLGALGLALLVAAVSIVASGITRPIRALATAVGKAGEDDPEFPLPDERRHDEIGVLTEALRRLRGSLQRHIRLRAESLAEQGRIENELRVAASIQQSMLPKPGAAASLPPGIQVAAALLPARGVGGDLYDYFNVQDGNVLVAVGDVSDKGIPAALFMARLSALVRVKGTSGMPLDRLLSRINARLSEGNDACMFVTLGCGLLDAGSGRFQYASAGHEAPLLRRMEGDVWPLVVEGGPALAIEDSADYPLDERYLAPGDTLIFYTDGVTDAEASNGSMFGLDRLRELLATAPDGVPSALVGRIVETVDAHSSGYHATDDVTVLGVQWAPSGVVADVHDGAPRWRLQPEPSEAGVLQAQRFLHAILAARDVARERIGEVELIAEELLTNIAREAAASNRATRLSVDCVLPPDEIVLTFRDDGPPFDPLARPDPDLDAPIAERDVGGLGILLVKQLAAACRYAREDSWNVLEVRLHRGLRPKRG